ncbi:MAG: RNA pyrophosphohydrolase [Sphingomonadales bacterium]|nr:RNA pyrophosphohydrolase [Sphingomonadales bacterium]
MTDKHNLQLLPYRPCVGMMVLNNDNKVFVGKRIDTTQEAWQMPQGGIDDGEDYATTALRELEEEIGTRNVEVIAQTTGWLYYDLPEHLLGKAWKGKYRGQKQVWFLMRFLGQDDEINIQTPHPEFDTWKWMDVEDLPNYIVSFKQDLYRTVIEGFNKHF